MQTLKIAGVLCFLAVFAGAAFGQSSEEDSLPAKADVIVRTEMREQKIPGASLAVMRDGKIIKAAGYGLANVELNVPLTPQMVFHTGSLAKAFTATAVMMLVEEGKIGLDEKISKYLREAPELWKEVTIRRLLTHTSGIRDYFGEDGDPKYDFHQDYTEEELVRKFAAQSLRFPTGDKWSYCNAGYVILGVVIHRVTGKLWFDFVKERIFDPLGMTSTRLISVDDIIPGRVSGYSTVNGQQKNDPWIAPSWNTTADGSLYTNVVDMAKWDAALNTDKLIKHSGLEQMWTPVKLNDGTTYPYGFAWRIREINGHRLIQHDGVDPAFTTRFARYVNDGLSIVVFLNLGEDNEAAMPTRITDEVASIYIPALESSKERETPANLSRKLNLPGLELQNLRLGRSDTENFSPAQQEVWDVSQAWLDAFNHHDLASFSRYISDDFIASTDEGDLLTKAEFLQYLSTRAAADVQKTDGHDFQIHVAGNTAIVNYLVTSLNRWGDTTLAFHRRRSEFLKKTDGKWLAVTAHESPVPVNFRKPEKTDPKTLKDYVGQYDWPRHAARDIDTYTIEDGRLMSEWRGTKRESFSMGKDTFFARDDIGSWTFVRDKQGRVTSYVYQYPDGQEIVARKIEAGGGQK